MTFQTAGSGAILRRIGQIRAAGMALFSGLPDEAASARMAAVTNIMLVAVLAYTLAGLTWQLLPGGKYTEPVLASGERSASGSAEKPRQYSIDKWHLFGIVGRADPQSAARTEAMPETRLRLTLRGIMAGDTPDSGGAIIAEANGREQFYAIGSEVPGRAVLHEVHADRVVLERNGRLETLKLPREALNSQQSATTNRSTRRTTPAQFQGQKSLRQYRDELTTNPQSLMGLVQMESVMSNGAMQGVRISPGRDPELFARYGLEPGDIVTAVNGIPLDNQSRGLSILPTLTDRDMVEITLVRRGVRQTLTFSLDD